MAQIKKYKKKLKGNNINLNFIYINQSKPNNPPNKKILKISKSCKLLNKSVNFKFNKKEKNKIEKKNIYINKKFNNTLKEKENKKGKIFKTKTNLNNKNIKMLTTNIRDKEKKKIL